MSLCEKCGKNMGTEVHHLQHQNEANDDGIIESADNVFHKNKLANLMTLCEGCHNDFHKKDVKHKRVKTTKGIQIREV
jgi:5-methylcytosine-specific restriction endonuclease McrA